MMEDAERKRLCGLYAITPDEPNTRRLLGRVIPVLAARPALLQYRAKGVGAAVRYEQALALVGLCREAQVPLVINDDLALAMAVDADGVHLGRNDGDVAAARAQLGRGRILGVSCYNEWSRAVDAVAAGADYVAFGALYPSTIKPEAVQAPLALLTRARRELDVMVVGIGGITRTNVDDVIAAGADLVAVISGVFDAQDPGMAAQYYRHRFEVIQPVVDPRAGSGSQ